MAEGRTDSHKLCSDFQLHLPVSRLMHTSLHTHTYTYTHTCMKDLYFLLQSWGKEKGCVIKPEEIYCLEQCTANALTEGLLSTFLLMAHPGLSTSLFWSLKLRMSSLVCKSSHLTSKPNQHLLPLPLCPLALSKPRLKDPDLHSEGEECVSLYGCTQYVSHQPSSIRVHKDYVYSLGHSIVIYGP